MIKINDRFIGDKQKVYVVAEIGINHNGNLELGKKMIQAAKLCGADAVKFQNYFTEDFILDNTIEYSYLSNDKKVVEKQFEMFKRYELSFDQLKQLKEFADDLEIDFFSTPTSKKGIDDLIKLNVKLLKNGSDFLQNLELIENMAATGIPLIISTGMANLSHIDEAVRAFESSGGKDLIILHCISQYPTPKEDVNLNKIPALKATFDYPVGFSDHTSGIVASIGAVALGACFIEKHFTISKSLPGPDHRFSCDPQELKELIQGIRFIEAALGNSKLGLVVNEKESSESFNLSCIANKDLLENHVIKETDVSFSRPGDGLSPKMKKILIGKKLKKNKNKGSKFDFNDFF
jgi:N-acetylneuraminate synthase/N,N'-diacetyllegionaminate synthase